ncbi:MAG TPA: hypothetical protein PLI94_06155 [Bacillota bacterium]|nr:hypothetical protein [Bacillota bacterium]
MKKLLLLFLAALMVLMVVGCGGSSNTDTTAEITFIVTVPDNTPDDATIYAIGSLPGCSWDPTYTGYALTKNTDGTYSGTFTIKMGTYGYKFTRGGSWDTVEKDENGQELSNRTLNVTGDATVTATIAKWADL